MESHKAGGGGGGGAGEVRRINVVYFLSRGGRTDHPHLFRVNHRSRAGVRLHDVKRWLSELRGKDMPDNFSWSYKRKYKGGYVWQDLKDDDLITPVSDNEYVLKGCDVRGTPPPCGQPPRAPPPPLDEKKFTEKEEKAPCNDQVHVHPVEVVLLTPDSDESSPKPPPPPPADQDSPPGGCGSAPFKIELSLELYERKHQQRQQQEGEEEGGEVVETAVAAAAAAAERRLRGAGGKSHAVAGGKQARRRMRVARALHSILTCGSADADDAAHRTVARRRGAGDGWPPTPTAACPGVDGCGLRAGRKAARARRGGGMDKQQGTTPRDGGGRRRDGGDAAYKPATLPRCSQCRKEFKPQELHSHMQSCRGFKERMRSSASSRASVDRASRSSAACHRRSPEPASAVFLLTEA
ncbi:hypothetical protein ACP4OV_024748 [Aristida adscensionis]